MYRVLVIDNYAAPSEGASSDGPAFQTLGDAVAYCQQVVDAFLLDELESGVAPAALWGQYTAFGEDPIVIDPDSTTPAFSGWDYARHRCHQLKR